MLTGCRPHAALRVDEKSTRCDNPVPRLQAPNDRRATAVRLADLDRTRLKKISSNFDIDHFTLSAVDDGLGRDRHISGGSNGKLHVYQHVGPQYKTWIISFDTNFEGSGIRVKQW